MLIAGNWKMNTTADEAVELASRVLGETADFTGVDIAVCPPFVHLSAVGRVVSGSSVRLGAQNMHHLDEGAYTGEVSALMLKSLNCHYVILGHSERRQYFGETDESVNQKVKQAITHGLVPIICVGESLAQREQGHEETVVRAQVEGVLDGVALDRGQDVVLAYEPVWAIGTGQTATPDQAQAMHAFIRDLLRARAGSAVAQELHILYGGSMKPANAEDLVNQPDINGGLIGGASLKAADFAAIVRAARDAG